MPSPAAMLPRPRLFQRRDRPKNRQAGNFSACRESGAENENGRKPSADFPDRRKGVANLLILMAAPIPTKPLFSPLFRISVNVLPAAGLLSTLVDHFEF